MSHFPPPIGDLHDAYTSNMVQPSMMLTVAQIEALAKAGVKVELAHTVIVKHDEPAPAYQYGALDLLNMVRDRWMMAMKAKNAVSAGNVFMESYFVNPLIAAAKHGDKVYIFAGGGNTAPHVIEDDAAIFPSDALLAKLHLMMEFGNDTTTAY